MQDKQKVPEGAQGTRICYQNGLIYCYETSSIFFHPVEKKYRPKFAVSTIKSIKVVCEKLKLLNFSIEGTLASCKERLLKYQKNIIKEYQ